jgi:CO dehydrogenase/acetyl-CoA synthase alpha subunit
MTQGGRSSAFCSPRRWPPLRAQRGACGSDLEAHTLRLLQIGNDLKQIAGSRIPVRAKHLVESLNVNLGMRGQLGKADCSIDVITQ